MVDQILRGPGIQYDRIGKPIPDMLAEWYFCERLNFRILPAGLSAGSIDDQPMDRLLYWMHVAGTEAGERERLEAERMKRSSKRK